MVLICKCVSNHVGFIFLQDRRQCTQALSHHNSDVLNRPDVTQSGKERQNMYLFTNGAEQRDRHLSEKFTCQTVDTQTICGFVNGVNTTTYQDCCKRLRHKVK